MLQRGKLLKIGPGPAYSAIEIAKRLPEIKIIGLELSNTMIEIAKNNAGEHGVSKKIAFQKGDASKMPFEDSEYDFVITSGSLHHWKKPTHWNENVKQLGATTYLRIGAKHGTRCIFN